MKQKRTKQPQGRIPSFRTRIRKIFKKRGTKRYKLNCIDLMNFVLVPKRKYFGSKLRPATSQRSSFLTTFDGNNKLSSYYQTGRRGSSVQILHKNKKFVNNKVSEGITWHPVKRETPESRNQSPDNNQGDCEFQTVGDSGNTSEWADGSSVETLIHVKPESECECIDLMLAEKTADKLEADKDENTDSSLQMYENVKPSALDIQEYLSIAKEFPTDVWRLNAEMYHSGVQTPPDTPTAILRREVHGLDYASLSKISTPPDKFWQLHNLVTVRDRRLPAQKDTLDKIEGAEKGDSCNEATASSETIVISDVEVISSKRSRASLNAEQENASGRWKRRRTSYRNSSENTSPPAIEKAAASLEAIACMPMTTDESTPASSTDITDISSQKSEASASAESNTLSTELSATSRKSIWNYVCNVVKNIFFN